MVSMRGKLLLKITVHYEREPLKKRLREDSEIKSK